MIGDIGAPLIGTAGGSRRVLQARDGCILIAHEPSWIDSSSYDALDLGG
jgi:hypothetical protein